MDIIRKNRTLFAIEGFLFIILGLLAIALPGISTLGVELMVGWLFLIGGLIQGVRTFKAHNLPGFYPSLLSATLSIFIGILLLAYPLTGVLTLTILLITFFLIEGIAKIALAFQLRDLDNWGWLAVSGALALILAAIIWSGWPGTAAWVIGLLVGINMLFFGFTLLSMALSPNSKSEK